MLVGLGAGELEGGGCTGVVEGTRAVTHEALVDGAWKGWELAIAAGSLNLVVLP